METADEVLAHFGVKGMKWGIRKDKSSSRVTSSDAQKARDAQEIIKRHGTQALDNKDLQHLVTRMNLERQYNNTIAQNPGKVRRGYGVAKDILAVGKTLQEVYNLSTGPMARAIGSAIESHQPATVGSIIDGHTKSK